MQPSPIKRRVFLQGLFGVPLLTFWKPSPVQAQEPSGLTYTDSINTDSATLRAALSDGDLTTGVEYQP